MHTQNAKWRAIFTVGGVGQYTCLWAMCSFAHSTAEHQLSVSVERWYDYIATHNTVCTCTVRVYPVERQTVSSNTVMPFILTSIHQLSTQSQSLKHQPVVQVIDRSETNWISHLFGDLGKCIIWRKFWPSPNISTVMSTLFMSTLYFGTSF